MILSDREILREIQRLTDLGLNLAGVERVLSLQDEIERLRAQVRRLEREVRDAVERTHKQYRRELVLYEPPPLPVARRQWTSGS